MKKYLFLLMMLGFLLPVFAGIYTIGTGTSGAALAPYNGLYDYGWSKVIYTLDELNAAGLIGENQIVGIGFYVVNTPVNYEMDSQHIYVRHSDVTSYLGDNLVHPDSELFQNVFEGTITYNGSGWFYISFFEPFNWNGVQGLEFLFENRDGSYVSSQPTFAYTNTNPNYTMVYKQQDNSFPQGTSGTRSYNRPNIMIYTPLTDPPYAATLIAPADGATLVNTDSILSWDSVFGADGYKVYFGTNPSPPFVADVGIETTFNPAALENGTTYYWQIVPYNDFGNAGNCPIWSFTVVPEALVTIGDGTVSQSLPVNAYYGYTYSQSIYLQSEINIPNKRIEKIYYHWNGAGVGNNSNEWLVYMGHTDVNNFPNGTSWIPLSELTQVYAGTLEIPAVNGWIEIALDLPFIYNNEQNLVIAVDENKPGYDGSAQYFYCTDSSPYYRSLRYYTDNPNPDPASPPSGSYLTYYPNIKLQFGDLPDYPIFSYRPQSIDFGQSIHGSPSAPQNVTISNTGAGMLYLEPGDISLIGDFAAEFSFSTANLPVALAMGQSVDIPVSVIPYTVGEIGASLSIMYDGEEYLVELSAEGLPPGLAIIGNGDTNQSLPINAYYGYTYSQSIYLQSEINIPDKRIEKLYYYWNGGGVGTNSNEWLVYMGHTDRNAFSSSSDWVPLIELTPVFNGTLDILAEAGWIEITLDVPFAYNNMQNLVIAVDENKPGYDGSGRYFYCTPSSQNRSLRYYNDNTNPDPASVPAGTLVGAYPNIMLLLGDVPDTPVLSYQPNSIDFGRVFQGILSEAQSLVISNVGGGYLNLSSENISIIGENAADFIFATNNLPITLGSGESVVITVNVMPTTEDSLNATLRISYADEYYDVELSAIAFPAGANVIGNGEIATRYPMGAYFGYERSAALYKANELGAGNKRINTLGWYATLPMNIAVPTKIYLKTCAENYMNVTHLWSEFIEGATLVFDQDVLSITANDWNTFTLENTFDLYDGENFLVLVERNYGGSGSSYGSTFPGIYGTTMPSMHQVIQTDNSPPTGYSSTMTERPNLLFIAESFESTDAPSPAYLVAPANGATKVDAIPTLSWTPGSGTPTGYKLYLGTSNPPEYLQDMLDATSYTPNDELEYESTYFWQIVPYNEYGDAENCPIWSFTTKRNLLVNSYPFHDGFEDNNVDGMAVENWEQLLDGNYNNYWLANSSQSSYNRSPRTGDFNATLLYSSNAWLMRPFYMEAGKSYDFSLWARQNTADPDAAVVRLYWGDSNATIDMVNLTVQGITNGDYQKVSGIIEPAETGIYWLAINATVSYNPWYLSIDDIEVKERTGNPVLAIAPTELHFGEVGQYTHSWLPLHFTNIGGGYLNGEDIQIHIQGEDLENFSLEPGGIYNELGPDESESIFVVAMPLMEGLLSATVIVDYADQHFEIPVNVTGLPEGMVLIGNGEQKYDLPINPYYGYSYSQSIYLAQDIDPFFGGAKIINRLAYYWNGVQAANNSNLWTVYMGHKGTTTFTAQNDWLPLSQMQQVFSGMVALPATEGWIWLELNAPFVFDGARNLVVAVDENGSGYDNSNHYFLCSEDYNDRSLRYYADSTNPDPALPPAGTLVAGYPNIKLDMQTVPPYPQISIHPEQLIFGEMDLYDWKEITVVVTNTGGDTLRIANIFNDNPNVFSFELPFGFPINLATGQSISFVVSYFAGIPGDYSANITFDYYTASATLPVSASCVDRAISHFPYLQNFDDEWTGIPPAPQYWKVIDGNNDGITWSQNNQYIAPAHSGMWTAQGMGNNDDYLITVPLNLSDKNVRLKWWDKVEDATHPNNYQILISTTNSSIYAFGDTLLDVSCTNTTWQEHELDLSYFNGERIYVAFHQYYSSSPFYGFGIDDVLFEEIYSTPTLVCSPDTLDFGMVPLNEISAGKYVHLRNAGSGVLELSLEDIELSGPNADEFFFLTLDFPLYLEQNESYDLPVFVNSQTEGELSALLKVSHGDNIHYVQLLAEVMSEGTFILGDGEYTSRFPLGSYFGLERSLALYESGEWEYAGLDISQIGWYAGSSTLDSVPTKIYLKATLQDYLMAEPWDSLIQGASLVYDQIMPPISQAGWQKIVLTAPYTLEAGNNLMVIVERHAGGNGTGSSHGASIYATEMYDHFMTMSRDYHEDRESEMAGETFRPNLLIVSSLHDTEVPPHPTQAIYPGEAADSVSINPILRWEAAAGNPMGYKIYLGTEYPLTFIYDTFQTVYAPSTLAHNETYYWQIVPYNDYGDANDCPIWSFTTTPDNVMIVGYDDIDAQLPINPGSSFSFSQSIYRSYDIHHSRQYDVSPNPLRMDTIAYYWNGGEAAINSNQWEIFMKNTWKYNFDDEEDWVLLLEQDRVFSGSLELPEEAGWVEIQLDKPFYYDLSGSMLIAVKEYQDGFDNAGLYFHSTAYDYNQSLVTYSDAANPDPFAPPSGQLRNALPNIRINYYQSQDYSTPILDQAMDFYFIRNSTLELDFRDYIYWEGENWDDISITIEPTGAGEGFVFTYLPVNEAGIPGQYLVNISSPLQEAYQQQFIITAFNHENGRYTSTYSTLYLLQSFSPVFGTEGVFQYTGQTVQFIDNTLGNPNYWLWDFGDGSTSELQHPSHIYTQSGTYDVSLTLGHLEAGEESSFTFYGMLTMQGTAVDPGDLPDTWDPSGSPYNLFGGLEIPEGDDLTIDEGVEVLGFSPEPMVISGSLNAAGVTFNSGVPDSTWGGLQFVGTETRNENPSYLENCTILNATLPLSIQNSNPTLLELQIARSDTTTTYEGPGVAITGNSSPHIEGLQMGNYRGGIQIQNDGLGRALPLLTNIRIRNSGSASREEGERTMGIDLDGTVELTDVEIENTDTAIQMQGNANPLLTNIRIRNSGSASRDGIRSGIIIGDGSSPTLEEIEIEDVEQGIVFSEGTGIRAATSPLLTNIRIRNSGSASRDEALCIAGIKAFGERNLSLEDVEIEGFATGIKLENMERATSNPLLTNIRIRNSGSASRDIPGEKGMEVLGAITLELEDIEIDGYSNGILYNVDSSLRAAANPLLTNIRIRNSGSASREESLGIGLWGDINLEMDDAYIEGYTDGFRYYADGDSRATANPLLTNIRIRNSGSASREYPGNIGMDFRGLDRFTCENDSIGGYQIGMKIATGDDLRAASSPLLTNIRIRNSGSASRNDNIGILLEDNVRGHLKDSFIEAAGTGVKATALNRTVLERLQIFNCHTGMKIAGNNQQRKLKGHLIALESAYALVHPSPDYRALALQGTANWQIQQNTISGYGKILTANNTGAQAIDFNSNIAWSHQMQTAPFSLETASISTNYNNLHTDQLAGEGNIYIEPLFMDAAARDYSLHYDSPCIDSGSPNLPLELDGTRADMGAFTYLHRAAVEPDMRYIVAGTTVHFSNASWGHDHPASACEWDLNNDGQIESTARDWQYHFDTPGVYTLRLTMNTGTLQDTQVYEAFIVVQAPQLNAPEALNLGVQDNNIHLNWEPVTLNIGGIPQVVEYYIVYAADTPDAFFQYVGHTTGADTQFTHVGGADAPCRFYYVIGFNGSELELREYISRNQNVLREKKTDIELKKK